MRKDLIFLFLAVLTTAWGQARGQIINWEVWPHPLDKSTPIFPIPAKEEFINQVLPLLVDSSFTCYYLGLDAAGCGFIKYDFDEWDKYGLDETVPIITLNELAEKCYRDSLPSTWRQDSLTKADCIDADAAWKINHPMPSLHAGKPGGWSPKRKVFLQFWREWGKQPPQEHIVFYFSKPEFTDDGQYAVMNVTDDCGSECARGYTYLFRRKATGWKRIGRMLNWVS